MLKTEMKKYLRKIVILNFNAAKIALRLSTDFFKINILKRNLSGQSSSV